jgi:hypothetical protein
MVNASVCLRGRRPDLADDRKLHLDDRPDAAQILDRNGGIAKEVLAGEVCLQRHVPIRRRTLRCEDEIVRLEFQTCRGCRPPRKRGTQYAAACRFNHRGL